MKVTLFLVAVIPALSGCSSWDSIRQYFFGQSPLHERTDEQLARDCMRQIAGDRLDVLEAWSAERCYWDPRDPAGNLVYLQFQRVKDATQWRVVVMVRTQSSDWFFPREARYLSGDQLITVQRERVAADVKCSSYGCTHYELTAFEIRREHLSSWNRDVPFRIVGKWTQDMTLPGEMVRIAWRWLDARLHPPAQT